MIKIVSAWFAAITLIVASAGANAALTSAPIYAACQANFVRVELNKCSTHLNSIQQTTMVHSSCHAITMGPVTKEITIALQVILNSAGVAEYRQNIVNQYTDSACTTGAGTISAVGMYIETVLVAGTTVLLSYEYINLVALSNGTVYIKYADTGAWNQLSYSVKGYSER